MTTDGRGASIERTAEKRRRERPLAHGSIQPEQWKALESDGVELIQSFRVPYSKQNVWTLLRNLAQVAQCMPGARLTKVEEDGRAEGEVRVKLGPIISVFAGQIEVQPDEARFITVARGTGRDAMSGSNVRTIITYKVESVTESSSQVVVSVKFMLTGALAQFSRSGLLRDVADHITQVFAANLETSLLGEPIAGAKADVLDAGALTRMALWTRIRKFFRTQKV